MDKTIEINKTVNINLNGYDIQAEERVFWVEGGSLNLSGNGKIFETKPNYGAVTLKGSNDSSKEDYSTVSIGKDITLEGWSGIFIAQNGKTAYGVLVNMNGKINAVNDINGDTGIGIYVNGNIQNQYNSPIINLSNTAKITSSGTGVYSAGYSVYNINGAYISGVESGLGIKSGYFNILNGTIIGTGENKTPTPGNNNGINASGTAIQIESNKGYTGNVELYIKGGNITSNHSNVIYEYVVNNTTTSVKNIDISGGTYISKANKTVFSVSDSFQNEHNAFISGGSFSSDPLKYLKSGYSSSKTDNSLYKVLDSTVSTFGSRTNNNSNVTFIKLIPVIVVLTVVFYLYRAKIFSFFSS